MMNNLFSQRSFSGSQESTAALTLAAGMVLGAGVALLFAPKSGAELRKNLAKRFSFDRNEEFAEKAREEGGLPGPSPVKHIAP